MTDPATIATARVDVDLPDLADLPDIGDVLADTGRHRCGSPPPAAWLDYATHRWDHIEPDGANPGAIDTAT